MTHEGGAHAEWSYKVRKELRNPFACHDQRKHKRGMLDWAGLILGQIPQCM